MGSAMSVANVVINADSWLLLLRPDAHVRKPAPSPAAATPATPAVMKVSTQGTTDDRQHHVVHRRARVTAQLVEQSSVVAVKLTARRALMGWLNGVRGAPKVPGTATSGCSRSHCRTAANTSMALRISAARGASTGPPPSHPFQLGSRWFRVYIEPAWSPRGVTGLGLRIEQLHHQLGT